MDNIFNYLKILYLNKHDEYYDEDYDSKRDIAYNNERE